MPPLVNCVEPETVQVPAEWNPARNLPDVYPIMAKRKNLPRHPLPRNGSCLLRYRERTFISIPAFPFIRSICSFSVCTSVFITIFNYAFANIVKKFNFSDLLLRLYYICTVFVNVSKCQIVLLSVSCTCPKSGLLFLFALRDDCECLYFNC